MTPSPYIGLRAFDTENSENFFGRDRLVRRLLERLRESRFIAVLGMSGEGKSSLVLAGLIPALRAGYLAWDKGGGHLTRWDITTMRPDVNPLDGLARALAESQWGQKYGRSQSALLESLRRDPKSLTFFFRENATPSTRLLIIIDQFEELFTRTRNRDLKAQLDADRFVDAIMDASTRSNQIYILVTMRSEYLGHCSEYSDLADAITRGVFLVPRMRPTELVEAIEMPASLEGGRIEPALLSLLVDQSVKGIMSLPVLQHALMRMWLDATANGEASGEPEITMRHFERLGSEPGASLDGHLEQVFGELRPGQKVVAELLFRRITKQTSRNEETGEYNCVREPASVREILNLATLDDDLLQNMRPAEGMRIRDQARHLTEDNVREVVEKFRATNCTFLKPLTGRIDGSTVIDVSHEAVINNWGRAKLWAAEEGENARTFQELCERAQGASLLTDRDVFNRFNDWFHNARLWTNGPPISRAWADRYKGKRGYIDFDRASSFLKDSQQQLDRDALRQAIKDGKLTEAWDLIVRGVRLEDDFQRLDFAPHYFALVPDEISTAMRAEKQRGSREGGRPAPADQSQESVQTGLTSEQLNWAFPRGEKLNTSAGLGFRLQHYAAHGGSVRVLQHLSDMGLPFDVETDRGWSPFYLAVSNGQLNAAKWLHGKINNAARTTGRADKDKDLPLSQAIAWRAPSEKAEDRLALVRWLLDNGSNVNERNQRDTTPLHWAAGHGRSDIVGLLIDRGADKEAQSNELRTPLHNAAWNGHLDALTVLIERGAALDAQDNLGRTPLILAAAENDDNIASALIDKGANVQRSDRDGTTPLLAALRSPTWRPILPLVDILVRNGADVNAVYVPTGQSTLHLAMERPDSWGERNILLRILVKRGAFVDLDDNNGETPVTLALSRRLNNLAAYFLSDEAKTKYPDLDPQWLTSAASVGARDIVAMLLKRGARADMPSYSGTTALHAAAQAGQYHSLEMLADQPGIDLQVEDAEGLTPLRRALLEGKRRSAEVLIRHGAPMPRGLALEPSAEGPQIVMQSWTELCAAVKAQLQSGTQTSWPFEPLMKGAWTSLDPEAAVEALRPVLEQKDFLARTSTEQIDAVRSMPAPFVEGGRLCEARMSKDGEVLGYMTLLIHRTGFALVDSPPWKNEHFIDALRLGDRAAAEAYLRFYCGALAIDLGVLIPLESQGDGLRDVPGSAPHGAEPPLPAESPSPSLADARRRLDAAARPIEIRREPDGGLERWSGAFVAQYGPQIWNIRFGITERGEVRLNGEPSFAGPIPYRRSSYLNGLRIVTQD